MQVADAAGSDLPSQVARSNLGRAAARAGRFEEAEELLTHALQSFREMNAMFDIETEARLAELDVMRGRPDAALQQATATLEAAREAGGLAPVEALLHRVLGVARAQLGDLDAARASFEEALAIARRAEAPFEVAQTLNELSRVFGDENAGGRAARIFGELGVKR